MKCPVCKKEYLNNIAHCSQCGFPELNPFFLNESDALDWETRVVKPCRAIWEKAQSQRLETLPSLDDELEQYIPYSSMIRTLETSPLDYATRSRLIDYLHQIYIFQYNYPVRDRRGLLSAILFHMSQIDTVAAVTNENRLKYLALAHTEMKAEHYLACGEFGMAMACYAQYLGNNYFTSEITRFRDGENPILLVHNDLFYQILHNCQRICKCACLMAISFEFDDLCRKMDEIRYNDSDLFYFCGMRYNIQSPYQSDSLNEHLRTDGWHLKDCTYDKCWGQTKYSELFHSPLGTVGWVGSENEIDTLADHIRISGVSKLIEKSKLYNDAKEILCYGKAILELFGHCSKDDPNVKRLASIREKILPAQNRLVVDLFYIAGINADGTMMAWGWDDPVRCGVSSWKNIKAISVGSYHVVGLKSDNTVISTAVRNKHSSDRNYGQNNVADWSDIVAISTNYAHTIGLKSDGTVLAVGNNESGQCEVSEWSDIVAISAGNTHTVGLKSDGTVVAVGNNTCDECEVSGWRDIVAISACSHTVGLKADGTVVATGHNWTGECEVSDWRDIVAISAGQDYTVGLKSDGTVVAVGDNGSEQCEVSDWKDIVAINAGSDHTAGLRSDGTVVVTDDGIVGYRKIISNWRLFQNINTL